LKPVNDPLVVDSYDPIAGDKPGFLGGHPRNDLVDDRGEVGVKELP
jgi:hypothetical protein